MTPSLKSGILWARSKAIRVWEYQLIRRFGRPPAFAQPIFIIGAPRCGSTVLYQAITNHFDVLYIDNLICRWHENLLYGFRMSFKEFGDAPHDNFEADHGNTTTHGGHAPSECGQFWYRWLPVDRHFIDDDDISDEAVKQIRREITAVSNYYRRPMVFKNLNAGQRLRLIRRCFPDARLIYLRRDHDAQVRSIIKARHQLGIAEGEWWSIKPPGYESMLDLAEAGMVAAQIEAIERQIEMDLQLFPQMNCIAAEMVDLSADFVQSIGNRFGLRRREGGTLPVFKGNPEFKDSGGETANHE